MPKRALRDGAELLCVVMAEECLQVQQLCRTGAACKASLVSADEKCCPVYDSPLPALAATVARRRRR